MRLSKSFAAAFVVMVVSTTAHAESQADQRHNEGKRAFAKSDFEGARQSFLQAYALDPQPKFLWDLALSETKSGHALDALQHFKKYLGLPAATSADQSNARPFLVDLEGKTGHLVIDAPKGTRLSLDGAPVERDADGSLDVLPGKHHVEGKLLEKAETAEVEASAGAKTSLRLVFDTRSAATGTPIAAPAVPVERTQDPPAEPTSSGGSTGTWVGLTLIGVGAVSGATAIGFALGSSHQANVESQQRDPSDPTGSKCAASPSDPRCSALSTADAAKVRDKNLAIAFGVTGAVFVGGGIAAMILWPKHHATGAQITVTPLLLGASGLMINGRF